MTAGTLFINGKFPPGIANTHTQVDAVYVEDGMIREIGRAADLKLQLSSQTYRIIDWNGAYVLPGLADSHMHLGMHGMKLTMLDFSAATSKAEMLQLLTERARLTPEGEWILGLNWNENNFSPAVAPTIEELDAVTDRHPVYLTRTCFHAFLANTEAFRRAGITDQTPEPASGAFGRGEDGRLNGWIYEEACQPFIKVQPEPDYTAKKNALRVACQDALRLGLTAAHTEDLRFIGSLETMLQIHRELQEEGLHFRTHQLVYHTFLDEAESLGIKAGHGDEWLKIGAAKIFSDGAIGGRTAYLLEPYSDAPHTQGMAIQPLERLNEITRRARSLGYPIAVHAIGDAAADMTLRAMETHPLTKEFPLPDRLIHAQVLNRALVDRMTRLHLAADIQPRFVPSDFPWVMERVGKERTEYLYAWKKLLQAGIACAGGSDAPIEPLNPFLGLHAAVTRRQPGTDFEGFLPEEKLSIDESIRLFTVGSAQAAGDEHVRGAIKPGMAADFTVVDRDISMDSEELLRVQVQMTVVNGKAAYSAS
ncbi:amidohydrolase [Paenibacillus sp. CAA11]|uniref:amidohydrolase n=1 Tax=Paenibacillus sp. CAA11 TaxID=1532905 RepID=UPI000D3AF047|nr:amidohydrolase [Paenibacillus sp. CAA11]AWB43996.1 amidohydrolase [Paenibacillus sp. CAA11]